MQGYENPNVCKEIYLPLDYNFIYDHDQKTFKKFFEDYKEKYGIELHDLFELKSTLDNYYYIFLKTPYKLFTYADTHNDYGELKNMVGFGIHDINKSRITESGTNALLSIGCGLVGNKGFGFKIAIGNTAPNSIDDLCVELLEY